MTQEKLIERVQNSGDYSPDERELAVDMINLVSQSLESGESIDDLITETKEQISDSKKAARIADLIQLTGKALMTG